MTCRFSVVFTNAASFSVFSVCLTSPVQWELGRPRLRRHQCIAVHWNGDSLNLFDPLTISSSSPPMINLLSQKHDRVTCATKQIRRDSKDTDATKGLVFTTWHFWRVWYYTKSNSVYQSIHAYVHLSDTLLYCHWVYAHCHYELFS